MSWQIKANELSKTQWPSLSADTSRAASIKQIDQFSRPESVRNSAEKDVTLTRPFWIRTAKIALTNAEYLSECVSDSDDTNAPELGR